MVAENNPWWQRLKSWADRPTRITGDKGEIAAIAYQWTGNAAYARKSWSIIQPYASTLTMPITNHNATRILFEDYVWIYDWIYPALSPEERQTFLKLLNYMGDLVTGQAPVRWGTRSHNANGTIGHYFGLALLDLATKGDNPRAGSFLTTSWADGARTNVKPVGGLAATGINRDTMRNAIAQYMETAKGGVWVEGTNYQFAALEPLLQGVEGVRSATGKDYFPEVTAAAPDLARALIYQLTPDGRETHQWGDEEHPHLFQLKHRQTLVGILAGMTEHDPSIGPYVQELVNEFAAYPGESGAGLVPFPVFFLFYNPYAPAADWRTAGWPPELYSPGEGLLLFHDGWKASDSLYAAHMPADVSQDHQPNFFGDFQLYRHGEWALDHPQGYAIYPAAGGSMTNGMLLAGFAQLREAHGPIAEEVGAHGEYAYLAGSTGGQSMRENYRNPPPPFVHEWTRSLLYLPSQNKRTDTIIVYDRTNVVNPKTQPAYDRFDQREAPAIEAAPALKQWILHTPVSPTLAPGLISWTTPGGQQVDVSTLLPANQKRQIVNEHEMSITGHVLEALLNYQVRILPAVEQKWDTFLNIVQAHDSGMTLKNTLVRSAEGAVEGALVERPGEHDVLALFGAKPGADIPANPAARGLQPYNPRLLSQLAANRILHGGYRVSWNARSGDTDVYLFDLDPGKTWSASVDGNRVTVKVSRQGVGRLTVSSSGAHTLQLSP